MKSRRVILPVTTREKSTVTNITPQVEAACADSGISEGLVLVYPMHTSSAVYISDSDRNLCDDFQRVMSGLVPGGDTYLHDRTDYKKNADGHIKAILTGHHIVLPLTGGRLDLGTYQTVYYAEFDGCREKEILIKIIGE